MARLAPRLAALLLIAGAGCPAAGPQDGAGRGGEGRPLAGVWHVVRSGERIDQLARRFDVPPQDIEEINGLERYEALEPGRKIFIPGARGATKAAAAGRGGDGPAVAAGGGRAEAPASIAATGPRNTTFVWPVSGGQLTSRFGVRGAKRHEGIDIAAAAGTAVLAAAAGDVIYAGDGVRGYGNLILIRHQGGMVSVYAHNRKNLVQEGARVAQGQVIAEVGHSGRASGDHLHFEIRKGDAPQDPLGWVAPPPR